jgi:hypothetical protein
MSELRNSKMKIKSLCISTTQGRRIWNVQVKLCAFYAPLPLGNAAERR